MYTINFLLPYVLFVLFSIFTLYLLSYIIGGKAATHTLSIVLIALSFIHPSLSIEMYSFLEYNVRTSIGQRIKSNNMPNYQCETIAKKAKLPDEVMINCYQKWRYELPVLSYMLSKEEKCERTNQKAKGLYHTKRNLIALYGLGYRSKKDVLQTALHEKRHYMQIKNQQLPEPNITGVNAYKSPDKYKNDAAEKDARQYAQEKIKKISTDTKDTGLYQHNNKQCQ